MVNASAPLLTTFLSFLALGDSTDPLTWIVAAAGGVAVGVVGSYFLFSRRPQQRVVSMPVQRSEVRASRSESVPAEELDKSKREMRSIMLERDLLSAALMKVYEAETEGRITREEREMIAKKYSDQIRGMQEKLKDVELIVEVGELEKLREELVTMFQEKIHNIETRLDQAKDRLGPAAPELAKKQAARIERASRADDLERAVEKRARPEMSDSERRVKEIRDEVMDALTKLEQIDVDKKPQDNV
ncbi:MAG: hypothetical protein OK422_00960 [Thaumarchaeota archaeon]|nr:hypothetical protein [Nitrososphaerota archaeon]